MPFGLFLALARGLVLPGFGRRQAKAHYSIPGAKSPRFRVPPEIADENDLVDAARHDSLLTLARRQTRSPTSERPAQSIIGIRPRHVSAQTMRKPLVHKGDIVVDRPGAEFVLAMFLARCQICGKRRSTDSC